MSPKASSSPSPIAERFEKLRRRGQEAILQGDLEAAYGSFESAHDLAESVGDRARADKAFCGMSAVDIELGAGEPCLRELSRILLRQRDHATSFLAAYNLARAHELRQELSRARFYARAAHQQAHLADRPDWLAASHNQLGSLLLADSYFDQASAHLLQALEHLPEDAEVERALVLDNLGYCYLMTSRGREGLGLLYRSLRILRRNRSERYEIQPHLSLSWGLLEANRLYLALRHAESARNLAEIHGDESSLKQSLFLLGEVTKAMGDEPLARSHFHRLQQTFYPDDANLPSLLMVVDGLRMVNLKA